MARISLEPLNRSLRTRKNDSSAGIIVDNDELLKSLAKAVHSGQIHQEDALKQIDSFVKAIVPPLQPDLMAKKESAIEALKNAEKDLAHTTQIASHLCPTKTIKETIYRQQWSAFSKWTFIVLITGSIFATFYGVLNASKALMAANLTFYGKSFQAFLAVLILAAPALAIKGLMAVTDEAGRKKVLVVSSWFLGIATFTFICLFAFVNAPGSAEATGDLFSQEVEVVNRWPGIILLFSQLFLEICATCTLMACAVSLLERNRSSEEQPTVVETDDYRSFKETETTLRTTVINIKNELGRIDSIIEEHHRQIQALCTEIQIRFFAHLRAI